MPNKKLTLKDWIMVPMVLLVAAIALPFLWLKRKLQRKSFSPARLLVRADEMRLIEEASSKRKSILINGKAVSLQPFDAERQHTHSNCESCPDEIHLDDVNDKPCLTASREVGEGLWRVATMEPIVWGLLGHTGADLVSLRVGGVSLGRAEKSAQVPS